MISRKPAVVIGIRKITRFAAKREESVYQNPARRCLMKPEPQRHSRYATAINSAGNSTQSILFDARYIRPKGIRAANRNWGAEAVKASDPILNKAFMSDKSLSHS